MISVRINYHFIDQLVQDIIIGVCSQCAGIQSKKVSNTNAFKPSTRSNTGCSPQVVAVSIYRRGDLQSAAYRVHFMANWYIFAYTALHIQCFCCASRKSGTVGGFAGIDNTWRLLWLNVKRPWLALVKPFLSFKTLLSP